jgi:hypothetical protein
MKVTNRSLNGAWKATAGLLENERILGTDTDYSAKPALAASS